MRRAIRRGARALVAAGALALSAQPLVAGPPVTSAVVDESAARRRLTVLEVQLAWLADPNTFSYHLGIQPFGATYEVSGFIPDAAARETALRLAQNCVGEPVVVDSLIEDKSVKPRVAGSDRERLRQTALQALRVQCKVVGLDVAVVSDGRIQVSGTVLSVEEKLAVSRKLTQVAGCTSVANNLAIETVLRHGQPVTEVSADGRLWIIGQLDHPLNADKGSGGAGNLVDNQPTTSNRTTSRGSAVAG